jgi:outer membrane protein assembly factor BamB
MSALAALVPALVALLASQETDDRLQLEEAEDGFLRQWAKAEEERDGVGLLRLFERAHEKFPDHLVRPDPEVALWIPLPRALARKLMLLPEAVRESHEAVAREVLDGVQDPGARRKAAARYAFTQAGRRALEALANDDFDRGAVLPALRGWALALENGYSPDLAARLAHAYALLGDAVALRRLRARADDERWTGDVAVGGRKIPLRAWLGELRPAAAPPAPPPGPAASNEVPLGRLELKADGGAYGKDGAAMIPTIASVDGRELLVLSNGLRVYALDPAKADGASLDSAFEWRHPKDGSVRTWLPWNHAQHRTKPAAGVAADGRRAYAVVFSREAPQRIQVGRRGQDNFEGPSALRAIDLRTGDLVWDTDEIVTEDGEETVRRVDRMSFGRKNFCFTGPPLLRGDRLYVPVMTSPSTSRECHVACFNAETGFPVWSARIAGSSRLREVNSITTLAEEGGTIVVQSNFGVVAALDSESGRVEWVSWYEPTRQSDPRAVPAPPVIAGGTVYTLAQDVDELLAWDRWTGKAVALPKSSVLWTDVHALVGRSGDWLVLQGRQNAAFRPLDGGVVNLVPDESPRAGRGAIAGGRFYLPTREGLRVFDTATWKLVESRAWPEGGGAGNLAAGAGTLAVLGERLELYSGAAPLRAAFALDLDSRPPRAEGCLRYGRILEEGGRFAEAAGAYAKALDALEKDPAAADRASEVRGKIAELREKSGR